MDAVHRNGGLEEKKSRETAMQGRNQLGLDEDSSDDADGDTPQPMRARRSRRQPSQRQSIVLDGAELDVVIIQRKLWINCTQSTVKAVIDRVVQNLVPAALTKARAAQQDALCVHDSKSSGPELRGRCFFNVKHEIWVVNYCKADGQRYCTQKGLGVSMRNGAGKNLTPEEYQQKLASKLELATRMWDNLDVSGRSRCVV